MSIFLLIPHYYLPPVLIRPTIGFIAGVEFELLPVAGLFPVFPGAGIGVIGVLSRARPTGSTISPFTSPSSSSSPPYVIW